MIDSGIILGPPKIALPSWVSAGNILSAPTDFTLWSRSGLGSVVPDAYTCPIAGHAADFVPETAATNIAHNLTLVATWAASAYHARAIVRGVRGRGVAVIFPTSRFATDNRVDFSLSGQGSALVVNGTPTPAITPLGQGWYLIEVTTDGAASAGSAVFQLRVLSATGGGTYTGDAAAGLLIAAAGVGAS